MKDIVTYNNFINEDLCSSLIQGTKDGAHKEIDAFYDEDIKEYQINNPYVLTLLRQQAGEYLSRYLDGSLSSVEGYSFNCANIIKYPDGITLPMHLDNPSCRTPENLTYTRTVGLLCFLNNDFDGGELIFPNQDKIIKPKPGTLVMFPINHLYPHMVNTVTKGERYALRINLFKKENVA